MIPDKYIGLVLAILSTMAIGTSFVITKKGLMHASERHGFEGEGFSYLKSPIWWGGVLTCTTIHHPFNTVGKPKLIREKMIVAMGEIANFAAYAFAPAILVTPLGALSVLIG